MRGFFDRLSWVLIVLTIWWPLTLGVVAFVYLIWLTIKMVETCGGSCVLPWA